MAFNPFRERGTPIAKQFQDWGVLSVTPYDKHTVHPDTRARILLMNGVEVEAALSSHCMARFTHDADLQRQLAVVRRVEQQQQKTINWLVPATESDIELSLAYEQTVVDVMAIQARREPDPYVRSAFEFTLIEDFDHLYRFANVLELVEGKDGGNIVGEQTEIFPGRPTVWQHRHPIDTIRKPYEQRKTHTVTKLHILTLLALEQQSMLFYMDRGTRLENQLARTLYQEIGQLEEQHVTHFASLADPTMTWLETLLLHEYNECYLYYSCIKSESDERIRDIWERHLMQEVEHLRIAGDLLKQYEHKEPEALLPSEFPELTVFQPNKDYIRHVIGSQINLTASGSEFIASTLLSFDAPYFQYQRAVNEGTMAPSQDVVEENIRLNGQDFRLETDGLHPVEWLRLREEVTI